MVALASPLVEPDDDEINALLSIAYHDDRETWEPIPDVDDELTDVGRMTLYRGGDRPTDGAETMTEAAAAQSRIVHAIDARPIVNADVEHADGERIVTPLPMATILASIRDATDGWPRRVGDALFVPSEDGIAWLTSTDALFGWLGHHIGAPSQFCREGRCHTRAEVYHELRRLSRDYLAVETLPHEPRMEGHYYACEWPHDGDGSSLRALVDRYCPATEIDHDLIMAMFATVLWGGAPGARPAYLIDSDAGRGSGKSTLASHVASLAGGSIELSANEDAGVIRQRLLSPEGMSKRVALLDNVKSLRFSWAELESLITTPTISGKRLYVGEGQRPNNLLWVITLNGASLAKDLSQRCVIVKLARPHRSATWAEETRAYIDEHREAIVADCLALLRSDRYPLTQYSRWAAWEHDVLSRLPDPSETQSVIRDRQQVADVEDEEAGILQDYIADQLRELRYDPDHDRVFLPSSLLTEWYCKATNDRASSAAVSRRLKQSISEGTIKLLTENRCNAWGRGLIWWGAASTPDRTVYTDIKSRLSNAF